jgi:putative NADH-flavin reductase
MNVLVFGATGKTGSLVVTQALARGHQVSALVRDPSRISNPAVRAIPGDATNPGDVLLAMPGHHAVIDTIGGTKPYLHQELERDAIRSIISAMKTVNVPRLIVVTMLGLGESRSQAPFWYKYLLMPTFLRGSTADKIDVEAQVRTSGLDFVLVRPPILTEDPPSTPHVLPAPQQAHKISRADLATFLVDQLTSDTFLHQAVTVANS